MINILSCIYRPPVERPVNEDDDRYLLGSSEPELSDGSPGSGSGSPEKPSSPKPALKRSRNQPTELTPLIEDANEIDEEGYGGYSVTPRETVTAKFWRPKPVSHLPHE